MKILHVVERFDDNYGGPAKSIAALCKGLAHSGVKSAVISVNGSVDRNELAELYEIPWKKVEPHKLGIGLYSPALRRKMFEAVSEADIVHLHSVWTFPSYYALKAAVFYGKPLVISPRSSLMASSLRKSRIKKYIAKLIYVKKMLRVANAAIVSSSEECLDLKKVDGLLAVYQIANPVIKFNVDRGLLRNEFRTKLGLSNSVKILGFVGRLDKRKNIRELVALANKVASRADDLYLLIAGPVCDEKYYKDILYDVEKCSLRERFRYLGMLDLDELSKFYSGIDLFVSLSEFENFGMSIAESMAYGTPVFVSEGCPWQELKELGIGWWGVCSEASLVNAINSDLEGVSGVVSNYIDERYGPNKLGALVHDVYKRCLNY
tara:strand:+ start:10848 stop:11978 length:1131 start_codon:yes stop_codon:yes gene_type:complete